MEKSGKDNLLKTTTKMFFLLLITSVLVFPNLNLYIANCIQGVTTGNNVQMYATLQLLQKMRDDTVCYILCNFNFYHGG